MPQNTHAPKHSSTWLVILVLIFAVILGISVYMLSTQSKKSGDKSPLAPTRLANPSPTVTTATTSAKLTQQEQERIDSWLEENNLNEYGDPIGTNYAGGTPLFDETTGETTDRYEYIVEQHPTRPWNN